MHDHQNGSEFGVNGNWLPVPLPSTGTRTGGSPAFYELMQACNVKTPDSEPRLFYCQKALDGGYHVCLLSPRSGRLS